MTSGQEPARPRVLLIDGNAALAAAVREVLVRNDCQADVATSRAQVHDYVARNEPVDVVVLDAKLPDADGHELLNHIRGDARWKLVKVIMLTSFDSTHDVRAARRAGADDYLFKPVRPERLVEHVLRMATAP